MRSLLLCTLSGIWVLGCNQPVVSPTPPTVGSETHWLEHCPADGCPDGTQCQCGVCTVHCVDDAACGGGQCVTAPTLTGVCPAVAEPICLAACEGGCTEGLTCQGDLCVAPPVVATVDSPLKPKVDFLFVVDNSGSMCEEQSVLAQAMAEVAPQLAGLDWRIAITSTDLNSPDDQGRFLARTAPAIQPANCMILPDTADCPDGLTPVLSSLQTGTALDLADRFRCMVNIGTNGYGFEKGLEAMRTALVCDGPNAERFGACCVDGVYDASCDAEPDFLRPAAGLVVAIISDEDDCSDHADAQARTHRASCTAAPDLAPGAFGALLLEEGACDAGTAADDCFTRTCAEATVRACQQIRCRVDESANANCYQQTDALTPVADFAAFLRSRKSDPQAIAYWPFTGRPLLLDDTLVRFAPGAPLAPECDRQDPAFDPSPERCCTPEGVCPGDPWISCNSALGSAFGGQRYTALSRLLSDQTCLPDEGCSLCTDDLNLAPMVRDALPRPVSAVCLPEVPACQSGACQGDEPAGAIVGVSVLLNGAPLTPEQWTPRWAVSPTCPFAVVLTDALSPGDRLQAQIAQ